MSDAPQQLIQIDRAIREPGGLAELIKHRPDTVDWLGWMIQVHTSPTCGALEELQEEEAYLSPPEVGQMPDTPQACPVRLLDAGQTPRPAYPLAKQAWRFAVEPSMTYRLLAQDGTLLWTGDLSAKPQTQQDTFVWQLAAASEPVETLIRRWPLPRWILTVEHHRLENGDYLDVLNHEEVG